MLNPVVAFKVVNEPTAGVVLPITAPLTLPPVITALAVLKLAVYNVVMLPLVAFKVGVVTLSAVTAPENEPETAVRLPILTLAYPELLILLTLVPVSVVAIASNAPSASIHPKNVLTEPYGAKVAEFLLTKIPISYPVNEPVYPLLNTTIGSLIYVLMEFNCV